MFQYANNIKIRGGSFTVLNEQNGMTGLQMLHRWVSDGAAHDSAQHAPKCHPDTRKTIIGEIMSWIEDPARTSSVLWFNGPAGAGKTAIAQSLCKLCAAAQWLAGSFFFSRLSPRRSNVEYLFSTIAFELSLAIPDVGKIIHEVVANDPSIPTKEPEIQLQKLILEPLQQVSEQPEHPIVIIIDGLDECDGEDVQSHILRLVGGIFQRPSCERICFIVTSRPEPWIHDEFTIEPLSSVTRQLFLGQTSEANEDIRTFFRSGFTEIHDSPKHRLTMSNIAKPWPSYRVLDDLRLDLITSIPVISSSAATSKPLGALYRLYSQILSTVPDKRRTLDILSALIAMRASTSGLYIEWSPHVELLRIAEKLLGLHPGDGPQALRMIHSLMHITERSLVSDIADDNLSPPEDLQIYYRNEDELRFHHRSFIDYLVDRSRSLEHCVDMKEMNTRLALACLVTMQTFSLKPASRIACLTWGYATLCWTHHVCKSGAPEQMVLEALMRFDILACYLNTLPSMGTECRETIKRVAFPSKPHTVMAKIAEKIRPKKDIMDKTCPSPSDIEIARDFMLHSGAQNDFTHFGYSRRLANVVRWMQVSNYLYPMRKEKLTSRTGAGEPRSSIGAYRTIPSYYQCP
ncbi:hypothetical protein M413DRAFT_443122 [Hebeloma cylindrosporum]|uniref:NACHT domain-containing protein n=1 Tax=Hebeloma cylindrosporum TaxID=76867 RepID=A0A0C3C5C8_HEBCY|nr:hypothetical protein M413DRAFT_443122 [Hebeloma cylindrosporum h7]